MTFMSVTRLLTSSLVYELMGLGGKGACHQVWHSELKPQNPEGRKRDQLPSWIDIFHVPSLQMWLVFVWGLSFYTSDLFWLVYSGLITIPFPLPLVCRTLWVCWSMFLSITLWSFLDRFPGLLFSQNHFLYVSVHDLPPTCTCTHTYHPTHACMHTQTYTLIDIYL